MPLHKKKNKTKKNKIIFRKSNNRRKKGGKTKKFNKKQKKIGIRIEERGSFTNEQDCLMKLREPNNKNGKCSLIGFGSYIIKKEIPVYE